ncbi:hypothetical protein NC651_013933 [Populus alba x Populus x berolinensis]|nr:hypothetical protein NC651_013933 [Populus alba x Populus x berolinensis]
MPKKKKKAKRGGQKPAHTQTESPMRGNRRRRQI